LRFSLVVRHIARQLGHKGYHFCIREAWFSKKIAEVTPSLAPRANGQHRDPPVE